MPRKSTVEMNKKKLNHDCTPLVLNSLLSIALQKKCTVLMACGLMKKGGVLNYNISLFLSLENNFGDLGAEEGEQGSLLVFVFSNVGIIIKLMFFLWKCVMVSVLSDGAIFISLIGRKIYIKKTCILRSLLDDFDITKRWILQNMGTLFSSVLKNI